ncbi:MAG: methionine--tRNA ligase [Rhodospirillales bacterium]|nr:methionine--tRNA ligase [Rhodospirillales bacterium]
MAPEPTYYITTPIYYVNDAPHIGHMYTTLACDVLARFKRLDGYRVRFLTGTDEHGQKVQKAAIAAGLTPLDFTDRVSGNFRDLAAHMHFTNDDFIRTTEARHRRSCQALWQRLIERGHIYLGSYAGWYAVRDEAFYGEGELIAGPGGEKLAPTGAPVEWVEEPSYFFRLSAWQAPLLRFYAENPDFIAPDSRRNEVISFVAGGLQDLSVSRTTFDWGIPVPGDDRHVMYVWLDALTNYITAVGFPDVECADYRTFWPADLHMVGKDILRFHAVYWPAFLMAADLAPPRRVFAHGWWTNEGQKISKSLGNVIDPNEIVARYGLDAVRYFMLREVPFGADGDFSHRAIVGRINGDLANDLGNLAQRSLSMIQQYCGGVLPDPGPLTDDDRVLLEAAGRLTDRVRGHLERQMFHLALTAIWETVASANVYVDRQGPWALRKSDPPRMQTVLSVLAETIRRIALLLQPFIPDAASRLLDQLAVPAAERGFAALAPGHRIASGAVLPKPSGVFPRFVEDGAAGTEKAGKGRG